MALTFDTRKAFQKLLQRGLPEPAADGIVEVVEEATSTVVTGDVLRSELQAVRAEMRADLYRALWLFGTTIVATLGVIVAVANAFE
ncbi:MAG: hypothetical protein OXE43_04570 [Chloroflexi bacterium]|nr:hypothetical protein [Chloroflexota bacterium]